MLVRLLFALLLFLDQSLVSAQQEPLISHESKPLKRLSFQDVLSGDLRPESTSLQWTSYGKDGSYVETNQTTGDLWLAHVLDKERQLLVNATKLRSLLSKENAGRQPAIKDYRLQPGGSQVLVAVNYTKLYRWSGFADYYVYDTDKDEIEPLTRAQAGDIRYATWSPKGDSIVFVQNNDLYVRKHDGRIHQITYDGSADIFNGVPDWVYEEEIFGASNTLWYSPDGRFIAYLRFNDTGVPTYRIPYYMTGDRSSPYPRELELRYPKAGQKVPTVTLHTLDLHHVDEGSKLLDFETFEPDNLVIGEVAWLTDAHSHLAWRSYNRVQDHEKVVVFETSGKTFLVASERRVEQGWLDNRQSMRYVPRMHSYVYISDESGWAHLYIQAVNSSVGLQITKGEWEVTSILHITSNTIFYTSTERSSRERHIYAVTLDFLNKYALVDTDKPGVYSASFSSEGGYYVLTTAGPGIPRQDVFAVNDSTKSIKTLQDNSVLATKLAAYNLPTLVWSTIQHPDHFELNILETRPPNFDSEKKYPLLLNPYGGPGSQETAKTFRGAGWWAYVASDPALEYVVLTVDGRGTGFKGRDFRSIVTGQLGQYEALDQIFAAQEWAKKPYIDESKIVIQGWSYGGYLSSKIIEKASNVFSSAIITAPVSDWLFYDSLYTERYMKRPQDNVIGYYDSSVHNTTGFANVRGGVLLQHGTGDDNVHIQNSFVLTDLLMRGGTSQQPSATATVRALKWDENLLDIRNRPEAITLDSISAFNPEIELAATETAEVMSGEAFEASKPVSPSRLTVQWFTDSDHGISFHGSTLFLRKQMARWLYREKRRKESDKEQTEEELWLADM